MKDMAPWTWWHAARRGLQLVAVIVALAVPQRATAAEEPHSQPAARQPSAPQPAVSVATPAVLKIANREITTLRAEVYGASPADRVRAIQERVTTLVREGGPLVVTTTEIPDGIAIRIDDSLVFRILHADTDAEIDETVQVAADRAMREFRVALDEMREARDSRAMAKGIGWTLLATVVLIFVLWVLLRAYLWVAKRVGNLVERRAERLVQTLGQHVMGQIGVVRLATAPVKVVALLLALLLVYEWVGIVLNLFPYTRPWGERLLGNLLDALGTFTARILAAVPALLFVLLIFVVARFIVRVLRLFFVGVEEGRIQVPWIDENTARPTGKLVSATIWLLALVAAYPYIPGSGSEAFKGIGVFVGLMLSIGSSGVVNQAVSGLMLMYTRSLRPGEFVQVGETEGIVRAIGFVTTQIETLRHEQVTIPNAVIVGTVTRNYSRLKDQGGLRIPTKVTIGYDVPWRQVRAMLQLAAERTANVLGDPPPRILQTALLDHAVEYTMLVTIAEPTQRPSVLTELHANILDAFNENGVQIMSPVYEADPAAPKVVAREDWFKAPAPPQAK
jgi:small-conductance mechanosensitive channel